MAASFRRWRSSLSCCGLEAMQQSFSRAVSRRVNRRQRGGNVGAAKEEATVTLVTVEEQYHEGPILGACAGVGDSTSMMITMVHVTSTRMMKSF
jgi:hypothetical protein